MKQLAAGIPFIPPLGRFHLMEKVSFLTCSLQAVPTAINNLIFSLMGLMTV